MKIITFDTNYNRKLSSDRFVHIDLAPASEVPAEKLRTSVFKIMVADQSHEPVMVQVDSIVPFKLSHLSNIHTWPSHGMNTSEFINWQNRKGQISRETNLAVYYYRRVDKAG